VRLPNWLRITWWLLLLVGLTLFVWQRYHVLAEGETTIIDVLAFIIWIALLLIPLFQEVSLFGVSLKGEIKELKEEVKSEVAGLRSEIKNSIDMRTNIYVPGPPSDTKLPELEEQIKRALKSVLEERGIQPTTAEDAPMRVDHDTLLLFQARYNIEREIRRLYEQRFGSERRRVLPVYQMAKALADTDLIDKRIAGAIREVYSVASPAIHGEETTPAQVDFVREVAPGLVATLRTIQ
jgi:hypothetical protein